MNGEQKNGTGSSSNADTEVLLKWLTHLLLEEEPYPRVTRSLPVQITESESAKTWKPGKLTEVMKRFGYLEEDSSSEEEDNDRVNDIPVSTIASTVASLPSTAIPRSALPHNDDSQKSNTKSYGGVHRGIGLFKPRRRPFSPPRELPTPSVPAPTTSRPVTETSSFVKNNGVTHDGLFTQIGPSNSNRNYVLDSGVPIRPVTGSGYRNPVTAVQPKQNIEIETLTSSTSADPAQKLTSSFQSAAVALAISDRARGIKRTFPSAPEHNSDSKAPRLHANGNSKSEKKSEDSSENPEVNELMLDERMKNIEVKMVEAILNEVVEVGASTDWDDIAGLQGVKAIIREIIIWPMLRPDIFTGLRGPPKGILLFGPPGTGKTMIGRLIATQSQSTFFNISASSLTSKWIGDGEKMVRALFQVARCKQPAVIFIDEIDSILTQRSDTEHESSRRLKTEFLIQFDGCGTKSEDKILVIGVTNRPQELDEAARRRLVKRIYIPLPDTEGRKQLVKNLVRGQHASLQDSDFKKIAEISEGYSGADMASLCKEAAYGPIRDIGHDIQNIQVDKVRPMLLKDFETALKRVKASVATSDLGHYEDWDKQFGCHI